MTRPPRIARLSTELANQIAAGEVVERPASLVKELVENALDAGARRIRVTVELGGKRLVRVEDDGEGMTAEDAALALERHATSKISRLEDLASIMTLGFRGEALPSIASVSHLLMRTRARGAARGTEIRVSGGATVSTREVGASEGTTFEVTDLFYNVPARRKFLKSDGAETTQISRVVTQLALGNPSVGFSLTSGRRQLLQCPPAAGLEARLFQLYTDRDDLVEVRKQAGGITVTGFVAALAGSGQGPRRGPQNIFVNGRGVKDRTIAHAIVHAYSAATIKERSPEVHLFVEMSPDRVDVNVHPTKAEVRFLEQSLVHEVLRRAIGEALERGPVPEIALAPALGSRVGTPSSDGLTPAPHVLVGSAWSPAGVPMPAVGAFRSDAVAQSVGDLVREMRPATAAPEPVVDRPLQPLGQFRDTFIIAIDDEGIAIIDQHVAHERILFEQVMARLTAGPLESQQLLMPLLIELPAAERQALAAHGEALERLGFDVEAFGGDSLRVAAVPAIVDVGRCEAALRALAQDLDGLDQGAAIDEALRHMAATTACHAAVKANDRLTPEKMVYLLDELRRTAHSSVCPHGRPVVLRLSRKEIERRFERI
ncbi:MAG: DNA mismatch repair endonuclease MutL [Acidobacteria bacterium]|nr:DNA mismatch repair endonuclease MutL [Acidobacteriota bacterium]